MQRGLGIFFSVVVCGSLATFAVQAKAAKPGDVQVFTVEEVVPPAKKAAKLAPPKHRVVKKPLRAPVPVAAPVPTPPAAPTPVDAAPPVNPVPLDPYGAVAPAPPIDVAPLAPTPSPVDAYGAPPPADALPEPTVIPAVPAAPTPPASPPTPAAAPPPLPIGVKLSEFKGRLVQVTPEHFVVRALNEELRTFTRNKLPLTNVNAGDIVLVHVREDSGEVVGVDPTPQ